MKHYINEKYKYPNHDQEFKLVRVVEFVFHTHKIYHFECGHWCTDNVFCDMVRIKTGEQNYKQTKQLQLL